MLCYVVLKKTGNLKIMRVPSLLRSFYFLDFILENYRFGPSMVLYTLI